MSYLDRLSSIRIFELLKGMLSSLNQSLAFLARLFLLADLYKNNDTFLCKLPKGRKK